MLIYYPRYLIFNAKPVQSSPCFFFIKALRDVELDWYKVLGYRAVIYGNNSWNPAQSRATATTPAVFFGDVTTEEVSGKKNNSSLHLVSDGIGTL